MPKNAKAIILPDNDRETLEKLVGGQNTKGIRRDQH